MEDNADHSPAGSPPESKDGKILSCKFCWQSFSHSSALMLHLSTHTDKNSFRCDQCGSSHQTAENLHKHQCMHEVKVSNQETKLAPKQNQSDSGQMAKTVLLKYNVKKQLLVKPEDTASVGANESPQESVYVEKPFRCKKCGSCFLDKKSVFEHLCKKSKVETCDEEEIEVVMIEAPQEDPPKTEENQTQNDISSTLSLQRPVEHRTVDENLIQESPLQSPKRICIREESLKRGEKGKENEQERGKKSDHTVKKSLLTCDECGTGFENQLQLLIHKHWHKGKKALKCKYCERKFSDKGALEKHEKKHEKKKLYTCEHCEWTSSASDRLSLHLINEHPDKQIAPPEQDLLAPSPVPDTLVPNTVALEAVAPDTVLPDTVLPDTVLPDTVLPDTPVPNTAVSDTLVPNTVIPNDIVPYSAVERADIPKTAVRRADAPKTAVRRADIPKTAVGRVDIPKTAVGRADIPKTAVRRADIPKTAVGRADIPKTAVGRADIPKTAVRRADILKTAVGRADIPKTAVRRADLPKTAVRRADIPKTAVRRADIPKTAVGRADIPKTAVGRADIPKTAVRRLAVRVDVPNTTVQRADVPDSAVRADVPNTVVRRADVPNTVLQRADVPNTLVTRTHICKICDKRFKSKHHLQEHVYVHTGKPFKCEVCGRGFVRARLLEQHHPLCGKREFRCVYCREIFPTLMEKNAHSCCRLFNDGQAPYNHIDGDESTDRACKYSCNLCKENFLYPSHLAIHKCDVESTEKTYYCEDCEKVVMVGATALSNVFTLANISKVKCFINNHTLINL